MRRLVTIRNKAHLHTERKSVIMQITEKQYEGRDILIESRPSNRCDIGTQMTLDF